MGIAEGNRERFRQGMGFSGGARNLARQNKPKGFMCVSCSWAKPADYHTFEFCENGAKATIWELTRRRCTPDFFAEHTVTRTARLDRLRSGTAGPPDPSDAL